MLYYPISKILNILDLEDDAQFIKDFNNKNSDISKSYQKGVDKADFVLDLKLFKMASSGDLKALEKYELRRKANIRKGEIEGKRQYILIIKICINFAV